MRYVASGVVTMKVVGLALVLGCVVVCSGCGGAAPGASPAPDSAADAEEPAYPAGQPGYGQPGYGQPGPPAQKSHQSPAGAVPGVGPDARPLLPDRKLDTLDDALAALTDDQQLLDEALGEPIPTAELGLSACRRVCSAIGSMRRSARAICDLAGEDDPRCSDARDTVDENERRVANAGCSC